MRFEKAEQLLHLAEQMQASSEGISLSDIQQKFDVGRRTAERMRDAVIRLFPNVEERVQEDKTKKWRLFHPTQIIEEQKDGSVIVSFEAAGWKEMCWHLFTWDGKVEILEPASLIDKYEMLTRRVMKRLGIQEAA